MGLGAQPRLDNEKRGGKPRRVSHADATVFLRACLLLVRQQLEVLVDEVTELIRHLFASGQVQIVAVTVNLATEPVLEPLQPFDHKRLEPGNLFRVSVGSRIVELPHRLDDFTQIADFTKVFGIQEPL